MIYFLLAVILVIVLTLSAIIIIKYCCMLNDNIFSFSRYDLKNNFLRPEYRINLINELDNSKYYGKSKDGDLNNTVNAFKGSERRVSLICEQWQLKSDELKTMVSFLIIDQQKNRRMHICNSNHK